MVFLMRVGASLVVALLAVMALLIGWSAQSVRAKAPESAPVPLHRAQALIGLIQSRCMGAEPCSVDEAVALAGQLAAVSPTAGESFLVVAYADPQRREIAAKQALERNHRFALAYALLNDVAATRGDAEKQLWMMERLLDLAVLDWETATTAMAALARTPQGFAAVKTRVQAGAKWGGFVLAKVAATDANPARLMPLSRQYPEAQVAIIGRLFRDASPLAAYLAWLDTFPENAAISVSWPYDGGFSGMPGVAPFNWRLATEGLEKHSGGGLHVTYFGRKTEVFAEQVMMLAPGAYRLETAAEGEVSATGAILHWRIVCIPSGEQILDSPLTSLTAQTRTISADFQRRETGCDAQRLTLTGVPGQFPSRARALIRSVSINNAERQNAELKSTTAEEPKP